MSFQDAVTTVVTKKYADFSGRARRSEFWYFVLAYVLLSIVVNIFNLVTDTKFLSYIVGLAVIVPSLAVGARRLHDTGRSGWWQLLWFVLVIGWIVLFVWFVMDSKPGNNQYGQSPKGGAEAFNQGPNPNWGQ